MKGESPVNKLVGHNTSQENGESLQESLGKEDTESSPSVSSPEKSNSAGNLTMDGESLTRPIIRSAVGNRVIERQDDEARAALAQSFWNKDTNQETESSQERSGEESTNNTTSVSSPDRSDKSSSAETMSGLAVTEARPVIRSAVGNKVVEGQDDEARATLAHSFWKKDTGQETGSSSQERSGEESSDFFG